MFKQVFADPDAYADYRQAKQRGDLEIEIVGSPAFQHLHWEYLKDPKSPTPLAFLLLASDPQAKASHDLVEATECTQLLARHGIPLVVLNACQSAKQENLDTETSSCWSVEGKTLTYGFKNIQIGQII